MATPTIRVVNPDAPAHRQLALLMATKERSFFKPRVSTRLHVSSAWESWWCHLDNMKMWGIYEVQQLTSTPRCDPSLWPGDDAELIAASQSVEDSLKSQHSLSASQPLKQRLTSRGASSSQTSGTQENSAHLSKEFENTVQSHQNKATVQPKHRESTEAAVRSKKLDTIGLTESSASQGHDHTTQLPLSHSPVETEGWVRLWENSNGIPSADISWLKEDTERGLFTPVQTYKDVTGVLKRRQVIKSDRMWFYPPEPPGVAVVVVVFFA
ncbi:uncharacterized protein LOC102078485 [Oreochromis niloticus]|uniref:uncharacterized protein LOC102078485 n=1 Tax=Oreochromis niloticus TaxID=8128 RepID=UPI00039413D7|nr:uncharacterized protein LOC102078485 [Oreochromis niloticus]XP_025758716.1 uncharacterized protein LOC102078485 [Oreochromis niloticus]